MDTVVQNVSKSASKLNIDVTNESVNMQDDTTRMDEKITDETQMRIELQRLIDRFDVIVLIERFWESLVLIALRNVL